MADNIPINTSTTPVTITLATDEIAGVHYEKVKSVFGVDGVAIMVSPLDPLPVTDADVLAKLNAGVDVSNFPATLTDAELRATPVVVSGTVTTTPTDVSALSKEATQLLVSGSLADILAELRDDTFTTSFLWEDVGANPSIFYREDRIRDQNNGSVTTVYTRLSDNVVVGSLPATAIPVAGNSDRLVEFYRYIAIAAGTGYSIGDWISNTLIFDSSGTGAVVANSWYNLTTAAAIATPSFANLKDPEYDNNLEATQLLVKGVLDSIKAKTDNLDVATSTLNKEVTQILIKDRLPASLRNSRLDAADTFTSGETLPDQSGSGTVLTFTFSALVDLVWVKSDVLDSRADPFGGTPSATQGIPCEAGIPQPITLRTSEVKVFAPLTATVKVWGYSYL